jgi:leader peptidase (prepilin peptidase) / N-methyltransferase
MNQILYFFIFILGASVGSFTNVWAERTARGEKISGRSHCEDCNHTLGPLDLIPLFSYVYLRGKCKYCKARLPIQYFLVELITGLLFLGIYYLLDSHRLTSTDYLNNAVHILDFGITVPLIFYFIITPALIALCITDFKYGMLYDKILLPAIGFVFTYKVLTLLYYFVTLYLRLKNDEFGKMLIQVGYLTSHTEFALKPFIYTVMGSIGIALFFLTLIIITRGRGMGGGDLKLGFLVGLLAGWPNMFIGLFLGFLTGAIASVILLLLKRKNLRGTIPFGPFLIIGCYVVIFFGNELFNWYSKTLLGLN